MIRYSQLQNFVEVVDRGSFSAAAGSLYVSQSALSQSVSSLESELGVQLIRRSRSGVCPTYFGMRVYASARDVLASFQEFDSGVREMLSERHTLSGQVRIQCTPGAEAYLSCAIVPELNAAYPALELITVPSTGIRDGFLSFAQSGCAMGLGACLSDSQEEVRRQTEAAGLVCEFCCSEDPQVLLSARNPLAKETSLSRDQVSRLKLVCFAFAPPPRYLSLFAGLASRAPGTASVVRLVSGSDDAAVFVASSIRREMSELKGRVRLVPFGFEDDTVVPVVHFLIHAPESALTRAEQCILQLIRSCPYTEQFPPQQYPGGKSR